MPAYSQNNGSGVVARRILFLALLLAAYHRILTEEMYKKTMPRMFTKEGLQLTGLMEVCKDEDLS